MKVKTYREVSVNYTLLFMGKGSMCCLHPGNKECCKNENYRLCQLLCKDTA